MMQLGKCQENEYLSSNVTHSVIQFNDNKPFPFSGTEKQAVAFDYAERIANGVSQCQVW